MITTLYCHVYWLILRFDCVFPLKYRLQGASLISLLQLADGIADIPLKSCSRLHKYWFLDLDSQNVTVTVYLSTFPYMHQSWAITGLWMAWFYHSCYNKLCKFNTTIHYLILDMWFIGKIVWQYFYYALD